MAGERRTLARVVMPISPAVARNATGRMTMPPSAASCRVASALRLLSIAFAAYAGDTALQRLEIISGIHEELDDTE